MTDIHSLKIGFYGAGRVGCTLGRYFKEHGLNVTGYYNRTRAGAEEAALWTDTGCYGSQAELMNENDVLFLTVSDQAIPEVVSELRRAGSLSGKFLIHTSGALSSEVFEGTGAYGYSIHPLYAIADRKTSYETINRAFFTVEGHPDYLEFWVNALQAMGLSARPITAENKVRYHASAVMASNLVCGLYVAATEELVKCGFSPEDAEKALKGLFLNNAMGITERGVTAQLTGPAERGDVTTVRKHLSVLEGDQSTIYAELSRKVLEIAEKKNPDRDYDGLRTLLNETRMER